ncbi:MAG: PepSY domain-containing protein [Sterolibacterium sp.]
MKPYRSSLLTLSVALLLATVANVPSWAGDGYDQDRARQALEAGEILPLNTILERLGRDNPGQIMEVKLERKEPRWIYEIKVLRTGGAMVKLKLDAHDGTLLETKERDGKSDHKR